MPSRRKSSRRLAGKNKGRSVATVFAAQRPVGTGAKYVLRSTYLFTSGTIVPATAFLAAMSFGQVAWPSNLVTFATQWDMYRMRRVRVRFIPQFNVNTSVTGTDDQLPNLAFAINYDDVVAPVSFASTVTQIGARTSRFDRPITTRWFAPATLVNAAQTGGNGNGVVLFQPWLNVSGNFALLVGLKYAIEAVTSTPGNGRFDVFVDMEVEFSQLAF